MVLIKIFFFFGFQYVAESHNLDEKSNNDLQSQVTSDNHDDNCDTHSIGSWKDGSSSTCESALVETPIPRMSSADMAQEDEFGEEEYDPQNIWSPSSMATPTKTCEKPTLPREQREYMRFMNVRRKKDFVCFERVKGRLVNTVEGLELHTGVFSAAEQKRIVNFVALLQEMGRKGQLKG